MEGNMHLGISAIHVIPGKTGSHEPYMVNLIRGLRGIEVPHKLTIFVTPLNRSLFYEAGDAFEYVTCPAFLHNRVARILYEQFILPLQIARRRIDVFHYPSNVTSVFSRRQDVVTVHFDSISQRSSLSPWHSAYYDLMLRINRRAGYVIVPSRVYAEELLCSFGYRSERMRPIYHGVNPAFHPASEPERAAARRQWNLPENLILSVTNTLPHKNLPNLVKAFDILLPRLADDTHMVLVGRLAPDILEQIIGESTNAGRLREHIRTIPFIPNDALPPIYGLAKAFAFVSRVETFGMPLVEAMACGLPVVASDIPVHREVLGDNIELLAPYDDPRQIAEKMYAVLTMPEVYAGAQRRSLKRSEEFSWERTAAETLKVYEDAYALMGRQ
jgi:glycosyltransferase involved in cell wall biosynthesis